MLLQCSCTPEKADRNRELPREMGVYVTFRRYEMTPKKNTAPSMSSKRKDIIDAATQIFLRDGFAGASINEIPVVADVSKRTLYKYFRSKTELFSAVIADRSDAYQNMFAARTNTHEDPRDVLIEYAQNYVEMALSPEALNLRRIVLAESQRFPVLAREFYTVGARRGAEILVDYLKKLDAAGILHVPDPEVTADQFSALCMGSLRSRAYFNPKLKADTKMINRWITAAVDLFLKGCGYRGKDRNLTQAKSKKPKTRVKAKV